MSGARWPKPSGPRPTEEPPNERDDGQPRDAFDLEMRSFAADLVLPPGTEILRAREPEALGDVRAAVLDGPGRSRSGARRWRSCAGRRSLGPRPRLGAARRAPGRRRWSWWSRTTPVPSRTAVTAASCGPWWSRSSPPGFPPESITLLVASGTHRVLSEDEMWAFCDERARHGRGRASAATTLPTTPGAGPRRPVGARGRGLCESHVR